jgi:hypothetical protein|tara:strand:- start:220 stop:357 length:138 start_codon:yes stop_codon:yes gene_type:complete
MIVPVIIWMKWIPFEVNFAAYKYRMIDMANSTGIKYGGRGSTPLI